MSSSRGPRKDPWKDGGAKGPTGGSNQPWRPAPITGAGGPPWWQTRQGKIVLLAGSIGVVLVTLVAVWLWPKPVKPPPLVLIKAGYEDDLAVPHNFWGAKGLDDLERWARDNPEWKDGVTPLALGKGLKDELKKTWETQWLQHAPKSVMVFVSAHGVARLENNGLVPYLVPPQAELESKDGLVPFSVVLDALDDPSLKAAQKLLLVDATPAGPHWLSGQLRNDFVRALKGEGVQKRIAGIPNLVVITSCDEDQRSWGSAEWQQTAFAHYVIEGLSGRADRGPDRDGRVDAKKLYTYVRDKVQNWARDERQRLQTPFMMDPHGQAAEMPLVALAGTGKDEPEDRSGEKAPETGDKELRAAWGECKRLGSTSPHPAAYAPQLWRHYLDTLLRAEQLYRAGSPRAPELLAKADRLARQVEESRGLALAKNSVSLTLAMPAALGFGAGKAQRDADNAAKSLWDAVSKDPKDEQEAALKKVLDPLLAAERDSTRRNVLRGQLADSVVREVARSPHDRWAGGVRLLEALERDVDPALYCRSAEAHYLMMAHPDPRRGSAAPDAALMGQSLALRRFAERAALGLGPGPDGDPPAYSEQVLPWVKTTVEEADEQRRLGQDLLFTSQSQQWDKAKAMLAKAEGLYKDAQRVALQVREALYQRDRALAVLPYYTRWLGEQDSPEVTPDEGRLVSVWEKTHALRQELETPAEGLAPDKAAEQAAKLQTLAADVSKGLQYLQGLLPTPERQHPNTQPQWHEIEGFLTVPFDGPELRQRLWTASRRVSGWLHENAGKDSGKEITAEDNAARAADTAKRQVRLARAAFAGNDRSVQERLKEALGSAGPDALTRAGEEVGAQLNRVREEADTLTEEAGRLDPAAAANKLRDAARCARQVEGGIVWRMRTDPVGEQRKLLVHNLLCWQAHRTYLDYWAARPQDARPEPYFRQAGNMFLDDAQALLAGTGPKDNKRLELVTKERSWIKDAPSVVVHWKPQGSREDHTGVDPLQPTDGKEQRVYWLEGPPQETDRKVLGHPVRWVEQSRGGALKGQREVCRFKEEFPEVVVDDVTSAPEEAWDYRFVGFFRGHRSEAVTKVQAHRPPEVVVALPPLPHAAHVAVQTEQELYKRFGAGHTAVALVLDCSGSMNNRKVENGPTRWARATAAVEAILSDLPPGVWISLYVFGAREHGSTDSDAKIERVWPPHVWEGLSRARSEWQKVKDLTPVGMTPLIPAICRAVDDLPRQLPVRTVVAITDGGDTCYYNPDAGYYGELRKRPGERMPAFFRRRFGEVGNLQVSVIGFEVDKKELKELPEAKQAYEDLPKALNAVQGHYYPADDFETLQQSLAQSLLQMYYRVDPEEGSDPGDTPDEVEAISLYSKSPRPIVRKPQYYVVRVPSVGIRQRTLLEPGDALLLELVPGAGGRGELHRAVYAESNLVQQTRRFKPQRRFKSDKYPWEWVLAVLKNRQLEGSDHLEMMVTLEKDLRRPLGVIQQVRPKAVWFEVPPAGPNGARAPRLEFKRQYYYPAPAWSLDVRGWPDPRAAPTAATVKAWWIDPEETFTPRDTFQVPPPFWSDQSGALSWLGDRGPGKAKVDSIRFQRPKVEGREVDALVIQLSYKPADGPYFVRLPGWEELHVSRRGEVISRGVEHRFYAGPQEGKYTGIFYPMTARDAEEEVRKIEVYSVEDLKKEAAAAKTAGNLALESAPNDRDSDPPQLIRGKD
jgi:hypothetical protein